MVKLKTFAKIFLVFNQRIIRFSIDFFIIFINLIYNLVIYKKPIYKKKINLENFNFTELKIDKKLYRIYELDRGRVFTNKNDITAYITKANFLTEGSMQFKKFDAINSRNQGFQLKQIKSLVFLIYF